MTSNTWKLLGLAAAGAMMMSGCVTQRYVTAQSWTNPNTLYVAYTEQTGGSSQAKVRKCSRRDDNSLACKDETDLNRVLNPK